MSVARKRIKDKDFFIYDDIPKELYDQRKQQQKKFKHALDKGYRVHFSKAHPDQLFVNGMFLPPRQTSEMNIYPLKRNTFLPTIAFLYCTLEVFFTAL